MNPFTFLTAALGFQSLASAHMLLSYPPAFRYEGNPNVPQGSIDYSLTSPLEADGSNFPCKGYQSDLGSAAGASVVTWVTGGTYNFTLGGSAPHDGGSCQIALSYDKGKTFTVIHSYMGGCPTVSPAGGSFSFNVPSDAPQGAAMFAWTWFNEVGNREMYMDCASVTITASASGKRASKRASTPFSSRPSLFVANLGNGCTTIEGTDTTFPDPGPDVTDVTKTPGGVTGTCKQVAGIGDFSSGSGNAATSPAGSSAAASSAAPVYSASSANTGAGTSAGVSSAAPVYSTSSANNGSGTVVTTASSYAAQTSSDSQTVTMSSAASTASATGTSTGSLSLSSDGSCGGSFGCQGSVHGNCCSQWGWCGSTTAYCGTGCQSSFGTCGTSNSSSSALQISADKTCGPTTSNTCQGSTYGNCCSQYGYCGSTSDYCGTGCQAGFGTCGQASSGNSSSPSSIVSPSPSAISSSAAASQAVSYPVDTMTEAITYTTTLTQTGGAYTATSGSSAASSGFTGVTLPTSQPSGFITMVSSTTTSASPSTSSTYIPDLVTIIPTHLRRRRQSGLTISPNGLCGSSTGYTCMGSNFGDCCSQYGYCGSLDAYCANGCQNGFGSCEIEIIPINTSA